ncbi:MAG: hypothetical protein GXZ11_02200 [Tissierellia bacterium]|nr:hypothetical protein [Tissierellia bacterium]
MKEKVILFHLKALGKAIFYAFASYFGVLIFLTLIFKVAAIDQSDASINISGIELIMAIVLFIVALSSYKSELRLMLQLGISRKTKWITTLVSVAICSVFLSVLSILLSEIATMVASPVQFNGSFPYIYTSISIIYRILICSTLFILFYYIGAFFTLIYSRMNTIGKIVFTTLLAAAAPILSFANVYLLNNMIYNAIVALTKYIAQSPVNLIICLSLSSLMLILITYIMNRDIDLTKGNANLSL